MVHDVLQNLLKVNEKVLVEALAHDDVKGGGGIHDAAITARQFCNAGVGKTVLERDGISKTTV
ncbi:hypothetical protein HAP47_0029720 [Bradyrhizobium sp. 41S5]|uniref:hypothetical protein n=1 Tax=Bradyrhizobium sp. 41S5 TaxID=1404443 RepID=UPI00156AF69D|nr:hypothetical protein [Bradyrhizobium sp. 41S5]UFX43370.1 hypothetical protein HAP47_0029720 [Bradyrhizobium sp. 41S5]